MWYLSLSFGKMAECNNTNPQIEYLGDKQSDGYKVLDKYKVSKMTAISIAVAIPLYPSHRTSRKEVEGGLIFF